MQEEVENKTVNLVVSTTKLTANSIIRAASRYLEKRKQAKSIPGREIPRGKQSVKKLIGQNQGVSSIDIAKTELRGFERYARKYNVDYAIKKDHSSDPPKYLVFFKARDADALTAAFKEYTASVLKKSQRVSILKQLHNILEKVSKQPERAAPHKEQSL